MSDDPVLTWLTSQWQEAVDEAVKAEDAAKKALEAKKEAEYALTAAEEAVKEARKVVLSAYLDVKTRDQEVQKYLRTKEVDEPAPPPEPLPPFDNWGKNKTDRRKDEYRVDQGTLAALTKCGRRGVTSRVLGKRMGIPMGTVTSYLTQLKFNGYARLNTKTHKWFVIPPEKRTNGAGRKDLFEEHPTP